MTDLTRQETIIIDTAQNAIETLQDGEDFFEAIDYYFGKSRGDVFQKAHYTVTGEVSDVYLPGTDNRRVECARMNYQNAQVEVVETWKWTGRRWQQI